MPSIEIDPEVWKRLQAEAEPLVDDPNTVLRRLLGLDGGPSNHSIHRSEATAPTRKGRRAPLGTLLPEAEYEAPILEALAERGGSAPTREVVAAVGESVADRLSKLDQEELESGGLRWENRVQFTRLRLKERGLLKADSPRGVWELTDAGWAEAGPKAK